MINQSSPDVRTSCSPPCCAQAPCHLLASPQDYPECSPVELSAMTEMLHISAPHVEARSPTLPLSSWSEGDSVKLKTTLFIQFASLPLSLRLPCRPGSGISDVAVVLRSSELQGPVEITLYPFHVQDGEFEGQRVQGSLRSGGVSDKAGIGEEGQGQGKAKLSSPGNMQGSPGMPPPPPSPPRSTH